MTDHPAFEILPPVVQRYLEAHGYVALTRKELAELENRPECRFEISTDYFGHPTHRKYVGTIGARPSEPLSGLHAIQCTACGHVTFETPVAMA